MNWFQSWGPAALLQTWGLGKVTWALQSALQVMSLCAVLLSKALVSSQIIHYKQHNWAQQFLFSGRLANIRINLHKIENLKTTLKWILKCSWRDLGLKTSCVLLYEQTTSSVIDCEPWAYITRQLRESTVNGITLHYLFVSHKSCISFPLPVCCKLHLVINRIINNSAKQSFCRI